jgi:hypothetical protein
MRDSASPRHYVPSPSAAASSTGVSSSHHNRQPHHSQNHHQYQNRPPFSPTNPKNVTNRTSSIEGDHSHSSNDPWKMNNKFPTSSSTTKLLPPNPEGRMTSNSTLPRVTSAPNQTVRRTFARGRLMEGPTATTSTTMTTNTSTNMDVWEGINDDPTAWATTAITSTNIMNDDSTWFVGDGDIVNNETSKNNFSNTNKEKNRKATTIGASIPSPFNWGRRTRSNNDVGNSYSSGSSSNLHNNNNAPFDLPSTDPWRLSNGASADSGERSLYDDSGEKIIRHASATSNRRLTSPKTTFVPLGSPSRPISTATTSATTDYHLSEADGSLTRPIAIHDCADVLDEREQDVLQNAARKQKGNSVLPTENRTKTSAGSSAIVPMISEPLQRNRNNAITLDDDIRDSDILQKATKRRQGLLEKKKLQQQGIVNENNITSAVAFSKPIPLDMNLSKIETSSQADESAQQITPKQNKGILGFFRGGVRIAIIMHQ